MSVLVENRFGELARVVGLFSARGHNIESLTVAETLDPQVSRITLVTNGNEQTIEKLLKQLEKQIRVLSAVDLTQSSHIERELALIHVKAEDETARQELMKLIKLFHAKVIDLSDDVLTIETTGKPENVSAMLRLLGPFGICEMVRAGTVAIGTYPTIKREAMAVD